VSWAELRALEQRDGPTVDADHDHIQPFLRAIG
jgi:hypothetical protein